MSIGGSSGSDKLKLVETDPPPASNEIGFDVFVGGIMSGHILLDKEDVIELWTGAGDDRVEVDPKIPNRVEAHPGSGFDKVIKNGANVGVFTEIPPG